MASRGGSVASKLLVGEIRKSPDTGNVWRLVRLADNGHYVYVVRVSNGTGDPL